MSVPNIGVLQGYINTGTENNSIFIRDVDPRLFYLESYKYPLASIVFAMGTALEMKDNGQYDAKGNSVVEQKPTVNPTFEHDESELLKFAFNPTAPVAAVDTTIAVSSSDDDYFVANQEILLTNAAGLTEVARITTVAANLLTVTRNIGSTGAITMTAADFFYQMGVVRAEDSLSTSARQVKPATLSNYVEFLAEPYGNTMIEQATANYHGDPYKRSKMEALARMKQKLEMMMWFGVKSKDDATTNPVYHNGGIMYWLQNQFTDVATLDVGGVLTRQVWDQWLQDALKFNNQKKVVFCSSAVLTAVNGFALNQLRPADVELRKFGMQIMEYQCPFGTVFLVREPIFDEVTSMNGGAVCLDMTNVSWRYLSANGVNLNLDFQDDIQENDRSGRKGQWLVVGGVQVAVGKSHAILKNVQS